MLKTKIFSTLTGAIFLSSCSPGKTIANLFWENDAAPWETVDAFYYPNRNDLTISQNSMDVAGVAGCREIVRYMAVVNNDPQLLRGDYECGVGRLENPGYAGINVYRLTIR
ncbi:hypothetical protein P6U16_13455 [Rhizobium sp. 32-5/1]|uniref:hypothetical protein n=1 Tax=Rhizobium sp. 32-5/1 TaxID=3019602 RepID=UPI00240D067B|nr:hypothetical protein [Rhizobium sp. 32-5/1]WEZ82183.1 hypothetical protein P6U16_13455 [Rhizobium sp. 32-5/1]